MIYSVIFILSLVVANLLVALLGPWFSIINAFVLIGLDLSLRDKLHESWNNDKLALKMGSLIVVSSLISYLLNSATGIIAIASFLAFALSMIADTLIYQVLKNKSWTIKSNLSNIGGSAVDSIVFPTIAFGGLMIEIVVMQFLAKVIGGFIWTYFLKRNHVLSAVG
jgi:uncharacterized PurR-regulated membrane protein YhhQ (DUF165 family)